jgi:hypothetical protein
MRLRAVAAAIALLLPAGFAAQAVEPALMPRQAVLVLKNRQVLEGEITPVGDYYLVALGKTGQIRLAAKDVEFVCRDLEEAYQRKAAQVRAKPSAAAHADLAEWCLRQKLFDHAHRELQIAHGLDPKHRRLAELAQRLEFATSKPKTTVAKPAPSTATVGEKQLERTMKELPPGAVEHFTTVVQPILMDRCGAARCHGAGNATQFQLLQPVAGKVPSRRFTQRNLFATISVVNKEIPDESRLLEMALQAHGHLGKAPFPRDDDRQFRQLALWVQSLRAVPESTQPATVSTARLGTHRPQVGENESSGAKPAAAENPTMTPVDPFDPEVFNRRYHGQDK